MSLAGIGTLEELEARFLEESAALLPADCLCWNNWSPDLSHLKNLSTNEAYTEPFENLMGTLNEVVAYHPIVVAGQIEATSEGVKRLSDFES